MSVQQNCETVGFKTFITILYISGRVSLTLAIAAYANDEQQGSENNSSRLFLSTDNNLLIHFQVHYCRNE